MASLDVLVGEWTLRMEDAWFLEPSDAAEAGGSVVVEWFGEAFLMLRFDLGGPMSLAIGRSDANDTYQVLYHDDRGVCRLFSMTWGDGRWTMNREDPDFHQRFVADVSPDRIDGRWEASEDEGRTWRKDFDLVFVRSARAFDV